MIDRHKFGCALALALFAWPTVAAAQSSETVLSGPMAFGDWTEDKPGVTRKIGAGDLPEPNPAGSSMGFPRMGERPASARLQTMPGFTVTEYSNAFEVPRTLTVAPNGDVFVVESRPAASKSCARGPTARVPARSRLSPKACRAPSAWPFIQPLIRSGYTLPRTTP